MDWFHIILKLLQLLVTVDTLYLVLEYLKISTTLYSLVRRNKQRKWTSYKRRVVNFHHCFPNCQDFIAVKIVSFLPLYRGFHTEGAHFPVEREGRVKKEVIFLHLKVILIQKLLEQKPSVEYEWRDKADWGFVCKRRVFTNHLYCYCLVKKGRVAPRSWGPCCLISTLLSY